MNTQAAKLCTIILVSVLAVSGCATNPVTGKSEFAWVSEEEEIRIGEDLLLEPPKHLTVYVFRFHV